MPSTLLASALIAALSLTSPIANASDRYTPSSASSTAPLPVYQFDYGYHARQQLAQNRDSQSNSTAPTAASFESRNTMIAPDASRLRAFNTDRIVLLRCGDSNATHDRVRHPPAYEATSNAPAPKTSNGSPHVALPTTRPITPMLEFSDYQKRTTTRKF